MEKVLIFLTFTMIAIFSPEFGYSIGIIIPRPPVPSPIILQSVELKSVDAHVVIENDFAETSIKHIFFNPNNQDLEGDFYFPIPTGATVTNFRLKINGKMVAGEVLDKDNAKSTYEDIVRTLKDPALMEWVDYNLYRVRLYPVQKLAEQEIIIEYTAPVPKDQNFYQYTLLTKHRPSPASTSSTDRIPFNVSMRIKEVSPIRHISSPTHQIKTETVQHETQVTSDIKLGSKNENFIVFYEKETQNIHVNFVSSVKNEEEKYFSLTVSPPRINNNHSSIGSNYLFILDTSGSMSDEGKMNHAKKALRYCINQIKKYDKFALIDFSTEARTFSKNFVDKSETSNALVWIDDLEARGGTNISAALESGFELIKTLDANSSVPTTMIFITDGQPTVGKTDTSTIIELIKNQIHKDLRKPRIFTFGLGTDVNTKLLDQIALNSGGVSDYILPGQDLEIPISRFFDKISRPAITNVKLDIEGLQVYDIYPQTLPDIFYGSPLTIFGRYKGSGEFKVKLAGESPNFISPLITTVSVPDKNRRKFIEKLWASRKIGFLLESVKLNGEKQELKEEVTKLGKEYDLVTPYTSFLVTENKEKTFSLPSNSRALPFSIPQRSLFSEESAAPALAKISGSVAVEASKNIQALKQTDSLAEAHSIEKSFNNGISDIRFAAGRTFYYVNNTWTEEGLENIKPDFKITFASSEWFQLRDKISQISEILTMGSEVFFKLPSGKTLLITTQKTDNINLNHILEK